MNPLFSSSLQYGLGLFETIHVVQGCPLFFGRHIKRMKEGARFFSLPFPQNEKRIYQKIRSSLPRRKGNGVIKLILSWNQSKPSFLWEWFPPSDIQSRKPHLLVQDVYKTHAYPWSQFKTISYANYWSARQMTQGKQVDALMLNEAGRVGDASSSSLFIVRAGKIKTPSLEEGALAGTRRSILLELAPTLGIAISESKISLSNIEEADEVFITSALKDIYPIQKVGSKKIKSYGGEVTRVLQQAYLELVTQEWKK